MPFDTLALSTIHIASQRLADSWQWYVIRASGFTAAGLLILLMISGIGQVTGFTFRFFEPVRAWLVHKALAIMLLFSIAVHGFFLLIDHYLPFSLTQILFPFVSHYNNGTTFLGMPLKSLAVSFGIVSMYLLVIIVVSSLRWINKIPKSWHLLHYLSYLVVVLIFLHGLYVGTDLRYGVFRLAWEFMGFILILGIISRLWRAKTAKGKTVSQ